MIDAPVYLVGDVHGQYEQLLNLLHAARLIRLDNSWSGGQALLCFVGDYVDRGPHGIKVIDLVMRLQVEAAMDGGRVEAILGNHDVMLLAAKQFGNSLPDGAELPLRYLWQQNGGRKADIDGLNETRIQWLSDLPAVLRLGTTLVQHADAALYLDYGSTIDSINGTIADILLCDDYEPWAELIVNFVRRMEFANGVSGTQLAKHYLAQLDSTSLVHGHTPLPMLARELPGVPGDRPWVYAEGQCTNIDGGIFLGESGFIYQLPSGDV